MSTPAIRTQRLTRRFGRLTAVDQVTLSIPKGRIYGFLGPNGSGKTTTIRMMCGLLEPSEGQVEVLGLQVPRDSERLRQRIGYMTQRFSLYQDLSALENLEFIGRIYSIPRRQRRQRIDELIQRYELTGQSNQRAETMSGGERQRLALAAATLHQPELLFLDEPTSAVDPENRRQFWESLFDLTDSGTTILVSTHYMDEAERCHRLAILDRGVVAADGTPQELKAGIGCSVVEIDAETIRPVKQALDDFPGLLTLTQLGSRLHVLVESAIPNPEARIGRLLEQQSIPARVRRTTPSLEDVFVAATR